MPARAIVKLCKRRSLLGKILLATSRFLMEKNARDRFKKFARYLSGKRILDVGVGVGSLFKINK
ncbi:MAG: hypothetical protein N2558_03570 [Patescibacteria group bacterium]|nr:hypothetical protein [Patescibacteria group bacterium]